MNVSLTPELEKMVAERVTSGRYASASEVIREALRLLEERDQLNQLRQEVRLGLEQLDQGRRLTALEWQVQNSLQGRICSYDLSRKATLGQTDRGLLEKGIKFRFGRRPRPGDFADCTHGFTLLGIKVGRKHELGCFRPSFSQNGTDNRVSAPLRHPLRTQL